MACLQTKAGFEGRKEPAPYLVATEPRSERKNCIAIFYWRKSRHPEIDYYFPECKSPLMQKFCSVRLIPHEKIDLSIVVPVKNETDNIVELAGEITEVMRKTSCSWECIWVDDGSTDTTPQKLQKIQEKWEEHHYLILSKNFGQSAALAMGFAHARGKWFMMLDGDGQNDPHDIPNLLKTLSTTSADVVNGWRKKRNDSFVRKISSRVANNFRNFITGDSIRDVGCSLRVMKREAIEGIPLFPGMHRFLPTLIRMNGFQNIVETPVNHRPRRFNKTKYGIYDRLWVGLVDLQGVRWLMKRRVYPTLRENTSPLLEKKI